MRDQPRIKVLIAEDEPHLGTILETFLTGRGYQVTTRRDGRAALEPLRAECAHFIESIETGATPRTDGAEGLRVLEVLDAAEAALRDTMNG